MKRFIEVPTLGRDKGELVIINSRLRYDLFSEMSEHDHPEEGRLTVFNHSSNNGSICTKMPMDELEALIEAKYDEAAKEHADLYKATYKEGNGEYHKEHIERLDAILKLVDGISLEDMS